MRAPGLFLLLLAAFLNPAGAQTILNEEFWAELEPLVPQGERTVSRETAVGRILDEGRFVFSGMIYGFSFSYTPSDRARKVEEEFELELFHEIPAGDPNLFVYQTHREGSRFFVRLRYGLLDFQESWYRGMRSNVFRAAGGTGEASYFQGPEEKKTAIVNAVKNAVREHARTRIGNKPRLIRGTASLDSAPRIVIDSGLYRARCSVNLRIDEVVPYEAF